MKRFKTGLSLLLLVASFISDGELFSHHPYQATIVVNSATAHVSAPNLTDLTSDLKQTTIEELLPFYTPESAAALLINLRGIDAIGAFAAGSPTFVVKIVQTGATETYTGATRDDSLQLFKEAIRDGDTPHHLLRAYSRYSPIDPIAGNPDSLMSSMSRADYWMGHLSPRAGCESCWESQPLVHLFQAGAEYGRAFCRGFDGTTLTMPLRYSYAPSYNWALILDAPLTYINNGGASSLFTSLAVGCRLPLTTFWSLTPTVRMGCGGSLDLCTAGNFVSTGVTSVLNWKVGPCVVSMTNYAGYYSSTNLWLSGINFNYHLHNWILRNGLMVTTCEGVVIAGRPVNGTISYANADFEGDRLFLNNYNELGAFLIANHVNELLDDDTLIVGGSYSWGERGYQGYHLSIVYQF